jgi:hypothetical protein
LPEECEEVYLGGRRAKIRKRKCSGFTGTLEKGEKEALMKEEKKKKKKKQIT